MDNDALLDKLKKDHERLKELMVQEYDRRHLEEDKMIEEDRKVKESHEDAQIVQLHTIREHLQSFMEENPVVELLDKYKQLIDAISCFFYQHKKAKEGELNDIYNDTLDQANTQLNHFSTAVQSLEKERLRTNALKQDTMNAIKQKELQWATEMKHSVQNEIMQDSETHKLQEKSRHEQYHNAITSLVTEYESRASSKQVEYEQLKARVSKIDQSIQRTQRRLSCLDSNKRDLIQKIDLLEDKLQTIQFKKNKSQQIALEKYHSVKASSQTAHKDASKELAILCKSSQNAIDELTHIRDRLLTMKKRQTRLVK